LSGDSGNSGWKTDRQIDEKPQELEENASRRAIKNFGLELDLRRMETGMKVRGMMLSEDGQLQLPQMELYAIDSKVHDLLSLRMRNRSGKTMAVHHMDLVSFERESLDFLLEDCFVRDYFLLDKIENFCVLTHPDSGKKCVLVFETLEDRKCFAKLQTLIGTFHRRHPKGNNVGVSMSASKSLERAGTADNMRSASMDGFKRNASPSSSNESTAPTENS